ncbi:MAG TPA: hypothetical protein VF595_14205 [Tepidisphaeraceae bacterium]|jgi:hypothetical protein
MLASAPLSAQTIAPPQVPLDVKGRDGVKAYLVTVVDSVNTAAADLKTAATAYADLAQQAGGPAEAAKSKPAEVAAQIKKLREAYQRIDSFGYEYVEGIVAGVPSLSKYDEELDSGLPRKDAVSPNDIVANVVIKAGPDTLDREGSLNNFLIEPTVFGTNDKFIVGKATLPGFSEPVGLPKPQLIVALADYAVDGYARLRKDARAWQPNNQDCFQAVYAMTPTLADYFDEWKETKKGGGSMGGRFVAVSRVSDMRGIMSSVQLTWDGLSEDVKAKDPALAESVSRGYGQIMKFIDTVDARDQAKPLNIETIDALGSQAKERADKLTVQAAQAAALLGVNVEAK